MKWICLTMLVIVASVLVYKNWHEPQDLRVKISAVTEQARSQIGQTAETVRENQTTVVKNIVYACLVILILSITYIVTAVVFARSDLRVFYVTLPVNRLALIVKGGQVTKVIYNSKNMKLIKKEGFPLGKLVPMTADGKDLQKLGPVEELLGIRYVGIPFIHSILEKKTSWISVEGTTFHSKNNEVIWNFAITKTFGYNLKELALGRNSDGNPQSESKNDDRKLQRILVNVRLMLQGTIEDPHLALIATDWMAGTEGKLSRFVQGFLGYTSQDELIMQKAPAKGGVHCELEQVIVDNKRNLEVYGVTFDDEKITYIDYDFAGGTENANKIQEANTKLYVAEQEALGIRAKKQAEQSDMKEQREITLQTVKDLLGQGLSKEQALAMALSMMRTKGLAETNLSTLVEGGASVSANISTDSTKKPRKKA